MCYGNILDDSMRKARKAHRCGECGRVIQPSEMYHLRDEFFTLKNCARCHAGTTSANPLGATQYSAMPLRAYGWGR